MVRLILILNLLFCISLSARTFKYDDIYPTIAGWERAAKYQYEENCKQNCTKFEVKPEEWNFTNGRGTISKPIHNGISIELVEEYYGCVAGTSFQSIASVTKEGLQFKRNFSFENIDSLDTPAQICLRDMREAIKARSDNENPIVILIRSIVVVVFLSIWMLVIVPFIAKPKALRKFFGYFMDFSITTMSLLILLSTFAPIMGWSFIYLIIPLVYFLKIRVKYKEEKSN